MAGGALDVEVDGAAAADLGVGAIDRVDTVERSRSTVSYAAWLSGALVSVPST